MVNTISSSSLNNAQDAIAKSLRQLSSGLRLNSAADDPAAASVAVSLSAQAMGLLQAATNATNGISLTDTAGGAVGQIGDTLQQMRQLAVQAGDGALSAADKLGIQNQFGQLSQQLNQIAGQAQFNGQNLLDGTFSSQIQTGANPGQTVPISIGNLSSGALGVANLDVTSAGGAASALNAIDSALGVVSTQQSQLGAASSAFAAAQSNATVAAENVVAANSRISDTDYAAATATLAQNRIQAQAAVKALSMYNQIQKQQVTSLLP